MMSVRSCPARPTNGSPWTSSSRPGASPTNIKSALGLPTPKTTCVLPLANRHFSQVITIRWKSPSRSGAACRVPGGGADMSRCVKPISFRNSSSRRRSSVTRQVLHDEVEDAVRDSQLRRLFDSGGRAVAGNDEDFVLIGVEADRRIGDVVRDDQIRLLAQEFFTRVLFERLRFGRKCDDERPWRRCRDRGEDVRTLLQGQRQLVALILFDFLCGGRGWSEVGDGGSFDDDLLSREVLHHSVVHLGGGGDARDIHADWRGERRRT